MFTAFIKSITRCYFVYMLALYSFQAQANTDRELMLRASDQKAVARGEKLYQSVCFGCHGLALEGGTGFNLRDAVWVHGGRPSQILESLERGFPDKGMMAFKNVYNSQSLKDIVAFILAKQVGLRHLKYDVYDGFEVDEKKRQFPDLKKLKLIKSVNHHNKELDFSIPIPGKTGIIYRGSIYVPKSENPIIVVTKLGPADIFKISAAGRQLKQEKFNKSTWHYAIRPGRQRFEVAYFNEGRTRVPRLYLKLGEELIPLNKAASSFEKQSTYNIIATSEAKVVRKKIDQLPIRSIAVGLPEKINYAFNAKSCSIVGIWGDDLLNIGPNIAERGKLASIPLGNRWFYDNKGIYLTIDGQQAPCKYTKYTRKGSPEFHFILDQVKLTLAAKRVTKTSITFAVTSSNLKNKKIKLNFPPSVEVSNPLGNVGENFLTIVPSGSRQFDFTVSPNSGGERNAN